MHHLIDGGSLRHDEKALIFAARVEDVNSLERHLLKTRLISRVSAGAGRVILLALEIVRVYLRLKLLISSWIVGWKRVIHCDQAIWPY